MKTIGEAAQEVCNPALKLTPMREWAPSPDIDYSAIAAKLRAYKQVRMIENKQSQNLAQYLRIKEPKFMPSKDSMLYKFALWVNNPNYERGITCSMLYLFGPMFVALGIAGCLSYLHIDKGISTVIVIVSVIGLYVMSGKVVDWLFKFGDYQSARKSLKV